MKRIYDMRCPACNHEFSVNKTMQEYNLVPTKCPECDSLAERDFSKGGKVIVDDQTRSRKGRRDDKW